MQKDFQQKIHQQKNNYHNIILLSCWSLALSIKCDGNQSFGAKINQIWQPLFTIIWCYSGNLWYWRSGIFHISNAVTNVQTAVKVVYTAHESHNKWSVDSEKQPPTYESLNMYTCCYTMLLTGVNQNYCCKGHWNFIKYTQKWKKPHPALWLPTMLSLLHFNNDQLHNRYFKQIYDNMQWKAPN